MEKERRRKLMFRWSLITAGIIACFWTLYYLKVGKIPVINSVKLDRNWVLELPIRVSRWWDILIGPIWSVLFILVLTGVKMKKEFSFLLAIASLSGLMFGGLFCKFIYSEIGISVFIAVFPIVIVGSFCLSLQQKDSASLLISLCFILGISLIIGLIHGLFTGFICTFLAPFLIGTLLIVLATSLCYLCSSARACFNRRNLSRVWSAVGKWVLAK